MRVGIIYFAKTRIYSLLSILYFLVAKLPVLPIKNFLSGQKISAVLVSFTLNIIAKTQFLWDIVTWELPDSTENEFFIESLDFFLALKRKPC